jgi:hypothetical protein
MNITNTTHRRRKMLASTLGAAVAAAPGVLFFGAAPAHAEIFGYDFQSPTGNIACAVYNLGGGKGSATCDIGNYTFQPPKPPPWGGDSCPDPNVARFSLGQTGDPPSVDCEGAWLWLHRAPGLSTLGYGQTRSVGAITCDSDPSGVTCTDTSTGHFFHVSHEVYQLG